MTGPTSSSAPRFPVGRSSFVTSVVSSDESNHASPRALAARVSGGATWYVASTQKSRRHIGFWLYLVSNVLWVAWGLHAHAYALILLQVGLAAMNIRGERKSAARFSSSSRCSTKRPNAIKSITAICSVRTIRSAPATGTSRSFNCRMISPPKGSRRGNKIIMSPGRMGASWPGRVAALSIRAVAFGAVSGFGTECGSFGSATARRPLNPGTRTGMKKIEAVIRPFKLDAVREAKEERS